MDILLWVVPERLESFEKGIFKSLMGLFQGNDVFCCQVFVDRDKYDVKFESKTVATISRKKNK